MSLEAVTSVFKEKAAEAGNIGSTLKVQLDIGNIFLDLSSDTPVVTNEDKDADCTLITTMEVLDQLRKGELNPMMAVMGGKVKIKGDMGIAMKLQSLLS